MRRTRIKICGLRTSEDVAAAVHHGADAIGLMHYEPSPRYVDLATASALRQQVPAFVDCVSVVANMEATAVHRLIERVQPDYLQFHGDEKVQFCEQFNLPYLRAIRVRNAADIMVAFEVYKGARGILVDAYNAQHYGGAGTSFDWQLIPNELRHRVILAGGLNVDNVTEAINQVKPYALDVSSGVERSKGVKDAAKIAAFIDAANATLCRQTDSNA